MLKTALLFQNHMILQRDKKISVWGEATPDVEITLTIQGKTFFTKADEDGRWIVECGPFETSFNEEMEIITEKEKLLFQDIQIGEVWLAGGQSNMEFHMRYDADLDVEKQSCRNNAIRFLDYPEVSYVGQIQEADYGKNYGFWRKAEPDQIERFSAVGYYFAKELWNKYQVPIGIIGCNWGGIPACAWMPREAVEKGRGQAYLDEYDEAIKQLDLEQYEKCLTETPGLYKTDLLENPISDVMMRGGTEKEFMDTLLKMGIDLSQLELTSFVPPVGPKYEGRPCGLYQSMLCQVAPYTIRGVIWYQGESDGDTKPELYHTIFPELIHSWRKLWKDEFPFLFVQIAPLNRWMSCTGESYVEIREAQQNTADIVEKTGMAVTSDVGMEWDIHPKKKQPVGVRLALLAENKVYGDQTVLCEAPSLVSAFTEEGCLRLYFDNAGDGLYLSEKVPYGQVVGKTTLGGLQIFQDGTELDTSDMISTARGNQVIVKGKEIRSGVLTKVKIAKTGWYLVNLYNSAGIPARPVELECGTTNEKE